ncbi:MAG: right-handed parallel beta-helix repeat-containing protein [Sedimentisphaerales bacterium]|nr:right-handed parallel beta-helix repeat-containing protein [Sedimentisphaerales bacterium]
MKRYIPVCSSILAAHYSFFLLITAFLLLVGSSAYAILCDAEDFAGFAEQWCRQCNPDNNWCNGYDYDTSGTIDVKDFSHFAEIWLTSNNQGVTTFLVAASNAHPTVKQIADYVCDGTADQVEIQAAMDILPALGGKVVLSEGVFTTAAKIEIPSYVWLQGAGYATELVCGAFSDPVLVNSEIDTGNTGITISDLKIDASAQISNQTGNNYENAIQFRKVTYSTISNIYASDTYRDIIRVDTSPYTTILNCTLVNAGNHGISAATASNNLTINDCRVINSDDGAIRLDSDDVIVANCLIDTASGGTAPHGLDLLGENIVVTSCVIKNIESSGILVSENSDTVIVQNCIIDTTGENSVFIRTSKNVTIDNCMLKNAAQTGVYITSSEQIIMKGCLIDSVIGTPLFTSSDVAGLTISDNIISDFRYNAEYFYIQADEVLITENSWVNPASASFAIEEATADGGNTGPDDCNSSGVFTGHEEITYTIEIDAEGTPDTFKWSKDGGNVWEAETVEITGSAQLLDNGVSITFAGTDNHDLGDKWTVDVTLSITRLVYIKAEAENVKISNNNFTLDSTPVSDSGGTNIVIENNLNKL